MVPRHLTPRPEDEIDAVHLFQGSAIMDGSITTLRISLAELSVYGSYLICAKM